MMPDMPSDGLPDIPYELPSRSYRGKLKQECRTSSSIREGQLQV